MNNQYGKSGKCTVPFLVTRTTNRNIASTTRKYLLWPSFTDRNQGRKCGKKRGEQEPQEGENEKNSKNNNEMVNVKE